MQQVSIKAILAKFARQFKPDSDAWVGNGVEWIGEAIGLLNYVKPLVLDCKKYNVTDHKVKLPCNVEHIVEVQYKCCYLPINRVTRKSNCKDHDTAYGFINGSYLQTSFKEGEITINYFTLPKDSEGYPLVPRNQYLFEAVSWYMLRAYLMQGNTHPTFNWQTADAMWEKWYPRAQNDIDFPSLLEQEQFAKTWVSLVPNIMEHYNGHTNSYNSITNYNGDVSLFREPTIN